MEGMPWCCAEFERHLGRLDSDGIRVDFFLKLPPRLGLRLFLLTKMLSRSQLGFLRADRAGSIWTPLRILKPEALREPELLS
jgi:hypothetical protein